MLLKIYNNESHSIIPIKVFNIFSFKSPKTSNQISQNFSGIEILSRFN